MDDFKNKWLGKVVDYDGVYGYQCVDIIKQYADEVHGLKAGAWGNAIDYWTKTHPDVLKKFDKVSGSAAQKGDLVVLNGLKGNPHGHIGIATGNTNASKVEILEQNGSTGNGKGEGGDRTRTRYVARSRVAGLLRPKSGGMTDKEAHDVGVFAYRTGLHREPESSKAAKAMGRRFEQGGQITPQSVISALQSIKNSKEWKEQHKKLKAKPKGDPDAGKFRQILDILGIKK